MPFRGNAGGPAEVRSGWAIFLFCDANGDEMKAFQLWCLSLVMIALLAGKDVSRSFSKAESPRSIKHGHTSQQHDWYAWSTYLQSSAADVP